MAQVGPGGVQQRAHPLQLALLPSHGHGCKARQAGATGKGQQQCFGLVVCMLGQCDGLDRAWAGACSIERDNAIGQCLVTGAARQILRACASCSGNVQLRYMQGNAALRTKTAAKRFKLCRRRLQPMVDVDGCHLPWPKLPASQQQGGGVSPAAKGHSQRALTGVQRGLQLRWQIGRRWLNWLVGQVGQALVSVNLP